MKVFFNNLLNYLRQNKNYLFLAIPFVLILLFIVAYTMTLQTSQNNKTNAEPTITPIKTQTPASVPTVSPTILPNPTQIEYERIMREQEQFEREFAEEQAAIQRNYPWFNRLPIQTDSYFAYFDAETETFVGKLYPKSSSQTSLDAQTESLKMEVMNRMRSLGIPTSQYPFNWQVIPEP